MQIRAYFGYRAINVYPFVTCVQLHYCTMYPLHQYNTDQYSHIFIVLTVPVVYLQDGLTPIG